MEGKREGPISQGRCSQTAMDISECYRTETRDTYDAWGAYIVDVVKLRRMLVLISRPMRTRPGELELLRIQSSTACSKLPLDLPESLRTAGGRRVKSMSHPRAFLLPSARKSALHTLLSAAKARHLRLTARHARMDDKSR